MLAHAMATTLFSHDLRLLTCVRCGAPVEAQVDGGSFTCGFCQAPNQVARRDESRDIEAARVALAAPVSEAERHARLREQDSRPSSMPDDVAQLLVDGILAPSDITAAVALWNDLRGQVGVGAPFATSERLFHLSVVLSPSLDARKRRALLETAIEILGDAGHRHVLRCVLARDAALAGDLEAAASWLAPTNPRPTDLSMDTAYRHAAATIATAQRDWSRVTELLGWSAADVPIADAEEVGCALLRANVLEVQNRGSAAVEELRAAVDKHGAAALRRSAAALSPLTPAAASVGSVLEAGYEIERREVRATLEQQRKLLVDAELPWWHPATMLVVFLVATFLSIFLAIPWACAVAPAADLDPWLGGHAALFCPMVCDGCTGPYVHVTYHTSGSGGESDHHNVYCRPPQMPEATFNEAGLFQNMASAAGHELPGGGAMLWVTSIPFFVPLVMLLIYANRMRRGGKRAQRARELRAIYEETKRALAAIGH